MSRRSLDLPVEDDEKVTTSKDPQEDTPRDEVASEHPDAPVGAPVPSSHSGRRVRRPEIISVAEMRRHFRNAALRQGEWTRQPGESVSADSQVAEDEVRQLLALAIDATHRQLQALLPQGAANLGDEARQHLLDHIVRLYTKRDIGKGFSTLVHALWSIIENHQAVDADCLRLFRDTLERLYAEPRIPYARARAVRNVLKRAELPVENRDLRNFVVDAIVASRA